MPTLALLPDGGLVCATSFCTLHLSYDGGYSWSRELPAHTMQYPGVELWGTDHMFVYDLWQNRGASIYRRVPQ